MTAHPPDGVPDGVPEGPSDDVSLTQRAQLRRAPRYRVFVLAGVLLVAVPTLIVVLVGGSGSRTGLTMLFAVGAAALVGALLGGVVAVLLDRSAVP